MEMIREIAECSICLEMFKDPRILSCIHTFCRNCLEDLASKDKSKPGDSMPCPMCRKPFVIPIEGMVGVQKNFFMERLLEILKLSESTSGVILCDACKTETEEEANEIPPAVQYCVECSQNVCDRCCRDHKRFKDLQTHQLIQIGGQFTDELMKKASLQYCDHHSRREMEMYCIDCRQLICLLCFAQRHKSHNCSDIEEVAKKLRKQISDDLENMSCFVEEATEKINRINSTQTNFKKTVDNIEKRIIQRGTELKEYVDRCTRSLLSELESTRKRISKEMKTRQDESETHKMVVESFDKYCKELCCKGSSTEICRAANEVHLRAEELQIEHLRQMQQELLLYELVFEASNVEERLKDENVVGIVREQHNELLFIRPSTDIRQAEESVRQMHLSESHESDIRQSEENVRQLHASESFESDEVQPDDRSEATVPIRFIGNLSLPSKSKVRGVTKMDDKIYVLSKNMFSIFVFDDEHPFDIRMRIEINQIKDPVDIGCNDASKCIYVTDKDNLCIWRITADEQVKWLAGMKDGPFTVSVSGEGHLLILTWGQPLNHLEIYGSDAKLIRRLTLPNCIRQPIHAIQTQTGEFIIIHNIKDQIRRPCALTQLTNDGQSVIGHFYPRDKSLQLKEPRHLALDPEKRRLFVADYFCYRVTVFDSSTFAVIRKLLTLDENGINQPKRLFYDEVKKRLIVAQWAGKVYIYETD